jgi:hypothetical protein
MAALAAWGRPTAWVRTGKYQPDKCNRDGHHEVPSAQAEKTRVVVNLDGWNNAFSSLLVVSIAGRAAAGGDLEFPWNVPAIRKLQ